MINKQILDIHIQALLEDIGDPDRNISEHMKGYIKGQLTILIWIRDGAESFVKASDEMRRLVALAKNKACRKESTDAET